MAGTDDYSFTNEEIESLKRRLSEFAQKNLDQQQRGLLVAIFAAAAEHAEAWSDPRCEELPSIAIKDKGQEINVPTGTNVDELIARLRQAFTPGGAGKPTVFCVVPVVPIIPKGP
jgi:hypothetical protein